MMLHQEKQIDSTFFKDVLHCAFEITDEIFHAESLDAIYPFVLKKIAQLYGWNYAEIWIPDTNQRNMVQSSWTYSDTEDARLFGVHSHEVNFAYNVGLPGRTWHERTPIWIPDVQTDPTFIRQDLAQKYNLHSGVTIPVLAFDHVDSILFFFSHSVIPYQKDMIDLLLFLSQNIGLMIVKSMLEKEVLSFQKGNIEFDANFSMIQKMFSYRDPYTVSHHHQVSDFAQKLAQALHLSSKAIDNITVAAKIHDVGKIYIPMELLSKPSKLTQPEVALIQEHPSIGYDIVKDFQFDDSIKRMVIEHHERMNGSGYPHHLQGNQIQFESRVLAVSDVVCAMLEHRPYRPAIPKEVIINELIRNQNTLYDPTVVEAAVKLLETYEIIH